MSLSTKRCHYANFLWLYSLSSIGATSPCYFDYTCAPPGTKQRIDAIIDENLVKRENAPASMFVLLRFLFATLCYHYDVLNEMLPASSKLRGSPIFAEASRHCNQEFAYVKYPWDKTEFTPVFTGIPPHVLLMSEMEQIKEKMELQTLEILQKFTDKLDFRGIRGQVFCATQILDEVKAVHKKIVDTLNSLSKNIPSRAESRASRQSSPRSHAENANKNTYFIGDMQDQEEERPSMVIYDDEDQEPVPLAVQ